MQGGKWRQNLEYELFLKKLSAAFHQNIDRLASTRRLSDERWREMLYVQQDSWASEPVDCAFGFGNVDIWISFTCSVCWSLHLVWEYCCTHWQLPWKLNGTFKAFWEPQEKISVTEHPRKLHCPQTAPALLDRTLLDVEHLLSITDNKESWFCHIEKQKAFIMLQPRSWMFPAFKSHQGVYKN